MTIGYIGIGKIGTGNTSTLATFKMQISSLKNFPHKILILWYNIRVVKILIQKKGISD